MFLSLRTVPFFSFAAASVVSALFACGSSSTSSGGGGGGASNNGSDGSAASSGGGAVSPTGSCMAPADECTLLTLSEADVALASMTDAGAGGTMGPGNTSLSEPASGSCSWQGSSSELSVTYDCGLGATSSQAYKTTFAAEVGAGTATAVSGLGDAAIWVESGSFPNGDNDGGSLSGGTLMILSNDLLVSITLEGAGTNAEVEARAVAAARLVLPRLF